MLKQKYFLTNFFILSAEKQPIKSSWRNIEWLQKYDKIKKALKLISEKERKIIILYYIKDLKLAEISSILKMPISTVHKTKDKAIERIKKILNV